jgi:arylsulfatase A-like enzyme
VDVNIMADMYQAGRLAIIVKIGTAFALLVSVYLLTGCGPPAEQAKPVAARTPEPPNIVLVLTDDQTVAEMKYMPEVRSLLAEEGTTFENTFVTDPLCCPSRATILRGQYAHNHLIEGNEPPYGGFEKFRMLGYEESTMATWLQDEGYRTVFLGKYMNGYDGTHVPPGWDEWYGIAGNYLSDNINENGRVRYYNPERYYVTDVLSEKATGYVRRTAGSDPPFFASDRPFFMWLGTKAPHQPATPAPRHEGAFSEEPLPKPPSFNEKDVLDKPDWVRDNPSLKPEQAAYMEKLYRNRLESLLAVDEMVGDLVDALEESGELSNTYIFFTSDNGFHMGQHRLGAGKWTAYEEDIRVPLIVRGPNVPKGAEREQLVLNNDLAPTFAEIGGAPVPSFVDGRSLRPLLGENPPPPGEWRSAFLVEALAELAGAPTPPFVEERSLKPLLTGDPLPEDWRSTFLEKAESREDWGRPGFEAIRTQRYLYVEYDTGERELYDLERDPYQLRNTYEGADPDLLRRLQERLGALRACAGADCRAVEGGY